MVSCLYTHAHREEHTDQNNGIKSTPTHSHREEHADYMVSKARLIHTRTERNTLIIWYQRHMHTQGLNYETNVTKEATFGGQRVKPLSGT